VAHLSITARPLAAGDAVLAYSLHPAVPQTAATFMLPQEDESKGSVISFELVHEEKGARPAELFLFSHAVQLGQSGSPVLSADSHHVVGIIDGQWLHPVQLAAAAGEKSQTIPQPGAALPIKYAIALLNQHQIPWDHRKP